MYIESCIICHIGVHEFCAYIDPNSPDGRLATDGFYYALKWVETAKFEYQLIARSYLIAKTVNARYLSKIVRPAQFLSKLFTQNKMNLVLEKDSDED